MKKLKLVRDEWRILSNKFVRHHRLPHGTQVTLVHTGASGHNHGRKVRNDLTVTRHLFKGKAKDTETITDLFGRYLVPALMINLAKRGLQFKLVGPNGEQPNGNARIKTIRAWPALPTADEIEADEVREAEIDEIAEGADLDLRTAEESRDDPELVLRGYARALIQRYGAAAAKAGLLPEL